MYSSSKMIGVLRYSIYGQNKHTMRCARYTSITCGSGDKKGDSSSTENTDYSSSPCDHNPSTPTLYECRKYGHNLPSRDSCPPFDPLPNFPTGIFRCTGGEKLGAGACKCGCYQCPEYFSYQHMTFYDMHMILRGCRGPSPKTGRKP